MSKEKSIKNAVTVYLTDDENDKVRKITEDKKISINQYMRDALNLKLSIQDKDEVFVESLMNDIKSLINNDTGINKLKEESDDLTERWEESMKQYDKRVEKQRYDNWVGKKTYFNGMEGY